jgi:hypothetical protein
VLAKNNVNLGDAFRSEIEGFNLLFGHANKNFGQTGVGLPLSRGPLVHRSGL